MRRIAIVPSRFYEFTFRRFFDDAGQPVFIPGPNAKRSSLFLNYP